MRALLVVHATELIEEILLRNSVGRWRTGSFRLQCPVHPLVSTVLLRMAWLDPLWSNAKLDPAH
jgi:hypothetical protein